MAFQMSEGFRHRVLDLSESESRIRHVQSLASGSHVHLSGICGTGMAAVGSLLQQLGYRVTGSDKAFYPPMGEFVSTVAERLFHGYRAENLDSQPTLVVIGNNLSRGNPEVERVLAEGIPYASMPEVFSALLIGERQQCPTSIVISGTHGKTTTSAATSVLFDRAGRKPGYFIGGMPADLPGNIRPVAKDVALAERVVILEGDEYDSAFFAKWAKFHSYRPDIAVITSLEFDHADIYSSVSQIEEEFSSFAMRVPEAGLILVCGESERLRNLGKLWAESSEVKAKVCFYGQDEGYPFRLVDRRTGTKGQSLVFCLKGRELTVSTELSGVHNALNLLAAASVGLELALGEENLKSGIEQFHGVWRRQQVIYDKRGILVIEDFAHHPTAVLMTLEGLKEAHPERRLIAVYEPRSNTARRAFFQDDYLRSFAPADLAVLLEVSDAGHYSATGEIVALEVGKLVKDLAERGVKARSFFSVDALESFLLNETKSGDLVVLMSNGDFSGLPQRLVDRL